MKLLNRLLLITFLLCTVFLVLIYIGLKKEVGDISKNNKMDDSNFCTKGFIYQYYQANTKYIGERKTIRDIFMAENLQMTSVKNGWIVIRFLVNYKGLTDRFRFFAIDESYGDQRVSNEEQEELIKIIRPLQNWEIGKAKEEKVDSYYQITLKIENAKIIDIF